MFSSHKRATVEAEIIRAVLFAAQGRGWDFQSVDIGDGEQRVQTLAEAVAEATSGDEAHVYLCHEPTGRESWFLFVLGNSGWDVISDYSLILQDAVDDVEALVSKYEEEDQS